MNIIKCRPPGNRDPLSEEIEACRPFTEQQLKILKPKLIVALGRFAGRYLLKRGEDSIRMMRGTLHTVEGIPVIVTYHPSALLHQENFRSHAWEDIVFIRHTADSLGLITSNGSQET
jgi:DNA polymerase